MKITEHPPHAPSLMESTRAIGYSVEAAISDIIDNSISAHAQNIHICYFPVHGQGPYIYILDDGDGMSEELLHEAMRYGSCDPEEERTKDDLGRYGLGLKTASLSQCRKLTVLSKERGMINGRCWDLNYIKQVNTWALQELEPDEMTGLPGYSDLQALEHGTLVLWQDLDKLLIGESDPKSALAKKLNPVRKHLSLVFHRYLTGETGLSKVSIMINNRPVEAHDPFLIGKSTQLMDDETILVRGEKIVVRPYILPHTSRLSATELDILKGEDGLRKDQGFYVYRNKRLLIWGTWFKLMRKGELSKLARVQVDIPNSLDDLWTLDVKKSTASPPEKVRKKLQIIIEKIGEGSKRTWTYRGKVEMRNPEIKIWNRMKTRDNGIFYQINREHPLVTALFESSPGSQNQLSSLFMQIENGLPLNQMYLDLNNDCSIENEKNFDDESILELLRLTLKDEESQNKKLALLEDLKGVPPFSEHLEVIEKSVSNGDLL